MRFTKMHGLGNDYVYVDCFHEKVPEAPAALSVSVSRRRRGIGSDGLILIEPCENADARMRIFNADGSEALMCGNGIRCVGKYLYDSGICPKTDMAIMTKSGVRYLSVEVQNGVAVGATVDMGEPVFGDAILCEGFVAHPVSMGNPHAVIFCKENVDDETFMRFGPRIEKSPLFPGGVNVEFTAVNGDDEIAVRVWERGSGPTDACGTGACAAFAAANRLGYVKSRANVALPGGALAISLREDGHILMYGPAETVFTGEWKDA